MNKTFRGMNNMARETLTAIIGPMFSRKTTRLIELYDSLPPHTVGIFKPQIDNRYGERTIGTFDGARRDATVCATSEEIIYNIGSRELEVVLIDEAQFFDPRIVEVANELANRGTKVYFTALNQNYLGEPFKFNGSSRHIGELIASADNIEMRTAICDVCGGPATKTQRLIDLEQEVLVGGAEAYTARCSEHHSPRLRL